MPNPARSRRPHQIGPRPASLTASRALTIVAVLGIVAALYFARAIFVPLAVAILLTFVLAPPVRLLRSWKVGRVTSVITVVTFAFLLIFGLGSVIGQQLTQLATNLPQYQLTIQEKIRTLRSTATSGSTIERVASLLRNLK